ncbi:MAG: TIGR02996 domain-containing protein [Archangiaceae bacterium]|nr:TIGR02996 domain-containing protein [Archangiaceae bacterium]
MAQEKDLLSEATAAWRVTRHPRWAAIASAAAKAELSKHPERPIVGAGKKKADTDAWHELAEENDPLDLARLFAALRTTTAEEATHRVKLLWRRNDPRIVDELLAVLEAPPWRANVFKKFVTQALEIFVDANDVRARDAMVDLAPRYKAIIETTVGDWTSSQLARAAKAMADVEPKKLSAKDEARLAELEQTFKPAPAKKQGKSRSDTELLELIYAAPDDDTPRLVFADSLSERGDVRGEFISLQVQRARGQGSPEQLQRERELAKDHKRLTAWALPLANGGTFRMGRGFPVAITLKPASAKKVLGDPAWATVNEVAWLDRLSTKLALEFLEHHTFGHVTRLSGLTSAIVTGLRPLERNWRDVSVTGPTKAFLSKLPSLTSLAVLSEEGSVVEPDLFEGLQLERLELATNWLKHLPEGLLRPLTTVHSLTIDDHAHLPLPVNALEGLENLRSLNLRVNHAPRPTLLEPVRLEHLTLTSHVLTEAAVDALLATQPQLKHLTLSTQQTFSGEAMAKWATKVQRLSVESYVCRYELEGGTLGFTTVPSDLSKSWLAGSAASGVVKRVRLMERRFDDDPLRFFDPRSDVEQVARMVTFFEAERGIPVERTIA